MNDITKTIMESLEDDLIDTLVWYIRQADSKHEAFEYIKSHLLQSQIRLIESWIQELKWDISFLHDCYENSECCPHCIRDNFIDSKISSLNETLEFLKKSL